MHANRLVVASMLLLTVTAPAGAASRRMFITSVSGQGNLGAWPDAMAVGATGLAAGDAICQARAGAAGLANPQDYRAWLSTTTDDAYCRVHGLGGKKGASCGQIGLPIAAGPWKRVDGSPFGNEIGRLLGPDYEVYLPPRLDENGNDVHDVVWTGTTFAGTFTSNCADWTENFSSTLGSGGSSDRTGAYWTQGDIVGCNASRHLLCFQLGVGDPLPPPANSGRLAFVTSATGSGDFSTWPQAGGQTGFAGGNAICRNLAAGAGLPRADSFKAWLSNGGTDAVDRFDHDGPWVRIDRIQVASSLAQLTDGTIRAPINVTETGEYLDNAATWTGTDASGQGTGDHCQNWSSVLDGGSTGSAPSADSRWTEGLAKPCDQDPEITHLYCLQDFPLVFDDGFESGNTDAWSAVGE